MGKLFSWRRHGPWLAGVTGLLLGMTTRGIFRSSSPEAVSGIRAPDIPSSRSRSQKAASAAVREGPTTLLLRELSGASAERCEELVREYLDGRVTGRDIELEAVFRRWMTLESPEAIREKLAGGWPDTVSGAFFHAWVAFDEAGAMDVTKHPERFRAARALFAIEHGYADFAAYLRGVDTFALGETKVGRALESLGRERPDIAREIAAAADLTVGLKAQGIEAVARGWAAADPVAAFEWLQSLSGVDVTKAVDAVFAGWAKRDLPGALAAFEASGQKPSMRLFSAPHEARVHLRFAVESDPFMDAAALHRRLSEMDIDWDRATFQSLGAEHDGWYCADPAVAAREIERLPPGQVRDFLLGSFCQSWLIEDREAALDFADRNGISSWLLDHARGAPDEELRRAAREAPEETFAALFDMSENAPGEIARGHLNDLAMQWAERDPESAADWILSQPTPDGFSDERSLLFGNILGHYWARQDALGVSRWLEDLPDEDAALRSRAWAAMQENVVNYSPDLAFAMSAAYLEGERRMQWLESHLEKVRGSIGHGAALELLKNQNLSAEESAALAEALRTKDATR